jgi:1-phosphatidylinositol-4-phosphate 5-kinase
VLSPSRPPFDLPSHIRHSYEKTNGNGRTSSYTSIKGSLGDAPDEDLDGGRPSVNGGSVSDTGLNSIPNGRMSMSSWDHRSSRNGSMISVNGNTNGAIDHGRRSPISRNTTPRLSNGDGGSNLTNGFAQTLKSSPVQARNGDNEPVKKASTPPQMPSDPQETAPATYSSSLHPPTPQLDTSVPHTGAKPPHRVSSPPAYPPPPIPWQSTPSPPHPGASTLKHRHTLQVPKAGSGRNSRDDDVLYTSGRFSPTGISAGVRRASLTLTRRNTQSVHSTILHEEIPQDEDAARWAEAVRQKRASKRRRKDEEDDDRVVVGTKVDQNHVNWVTAYNMLTGIRFTVSRTNAKLDRPLTDADFEAKHKFSFDM